MAAPLGYNYDVIHDGTAPADYSHGVPQHGWNTDHQHGNTAAPHDFQYGPPASQDHNYHGEFQNGADAGGHHVPDQEIKAPLATTAEVTNYQAINWPDGPRFLSQSRVFNILNAIVDTLLVLVALAFLGMAIIAMRLNDTSTEAELGATFEEAMRLGPTIYPILFAAIAGRALKGIGRFRAERGSRITTLWPLMNNKTMFDAVFSQWHMAQFSAVASGLVLLWALSPLGGQAALRLVYRANLTTTATHDLRYLDTGPLGNIYANHAVIENNDVEKGAVGIPMTMPALYEAALMQDAATKRGPVDNWGNVKIPRVDRLDPSLADPNGWFNISEETSVESFYSLLGLPTVNLPSGGVAEFTVESVHVALSAASLQSFGQARINNKTGLMFTGMEINCPDCINRFQNQGGDNGTVESARHQMLWGAPYPQFNATELANMTYSRARGIRFDSGTKGDTADSRSGTSIIECAVTQHFVEADIRCDFGSCRAVRVRASTTDHRHPNITTFDWWGTYALDMISVRSRADGSSVSSPSELFINDSSSSPIKPAFQMPQLNTVNLSRADPQVFADRATILLNTALQIFMAPSGFTGDLPRSNLSIYGVPHIPAKGTFEAAKAINKTSTPMPYPYELVISTTPAMTPFIAANTAARLTRFFEVYKADRGWVAVLILSSTILVITGLAGMFLGTRARAPDVFDPLMALTYDNPHLNLPGQASTLSGCERARLLAGVTVRLGDVQPYAEVGKIGLGETAEVQRVAKGRLYA